MCITLSVTYIWPFIFNVYIHIRALSFIVSNVVSLCIQHLLTVNRHLIFALFTYDRHCYDEGVLISPSLFSSPSSVSRFCAFSSSSSYRKLEMSCLISFSSPGLKKKNRCKAIKENVDASMGGQMVLFIILPSVISSLSLSACALMMYRFISRFMIFCNQ